MFPKTSEKLLSQAIEILNAGGIVVFPTDTAFGVGCRIDREKVIERLFKIRKRPARQAVPVLVSSIKMAKEYLLPFPKEVEGLMKKYWPGALTVVFPCQIAKVPSLVRGGGKTLGVRIPNHPIPLQLIKVLGIPIIGTSANFHGMPTPYKFEDLNQDFLKLADLTIPGECKIGLASTVIDCSQKPWKIIRQGNSKAGDMKLFIDTSDNTRTIIGLDKKRWEFETKEHKSQELLSLINQIIKKQDSSLHRLQVPIAISGRSSAEGGVAQPRMKPKASLNQITEIEVNLGPGSFTGLRVGISVANALSWALKIPINGKKVGELVEPKYEVK